MVDRLWNADEQSAETGLLVCDGNIFITEGKLHVSGMIEHIAQSAAAFTGYNNYLQGGKPKIGYIGEIKDCHIQRLPLIGERLFTRICVIAEAGGITLMSAESFLATAEGSSPLHDQQLLDCRIKIFMKE